MIYCTACGDKHENTGECNYCGCTIRLPDDVRTYSGLRVTPNHPFVVTRPDNGSHARRIAEVREILRAKAVFGEAQQYLPKYAHLNLLNIVERLGKAEDAIDAVLSAEGAGDMYYNAKQYRNKFPKEQS